MRLHPDTLAAIREAAQAAREADADDEALLWDTLEGETDALALLDRLIAAAQSDASLEAATREQAQRLGQRARRFADRAAGYRAAMRLVLDAIGTRRAERPGATVSLSPGRLSVEIHAPDQVPTQLRKPGEPDKAAIKRLLDAGEDVPGARLARGDDTISMRTT
jgi:hypothetical protein